MFPCIDKKKTQNKQDSPTGHTNAEVVFSNLPYGQLGLFFILGDKMSDYALSNKGE